VVVKALFYEPGGRGFETRWGTNSYDREVYSASNRNEYQEMILWSKALPARKADKVSAIC
jgi:hypothetical protein